MDKKIENLVNWFQKERNINFDGFSHLKVKKYEGMGYGVCYTGEEKEYRYGGYGGSILLWIPYRLLLSRENIGEKTNFLRQLNFDADKVRNSFRNSYENLHKKSLDVDLKEHEMDEALLTMFLVYCKNNREEENYWKPYTDFVCDLPAQGEFQYMSNDYFSTILPTIKEMYKEAKRELKERMPNPNEDDSEYKILYSSVKTRASKFVDPNSGIIGNTYMIPFFDFLNHKQRDTHDENQEGEEKRVNSFTIFYNNYDGKNNAFISPQPGEVVKLKNGEQVFIYYGKELRHYGINETEEREIEQQKLQAQIEVPAKK